MPTTYKYRLLSLSFLALQAASQAMAQADTTVTDSIVRTEQLRSVVVSAASGMRSRFSIGNTEIIGERQLVRAACCNLGESFTANPSVDVSYGDAATGARQIKLLGLSGTYVQMLTENVPNLRGACLPYSLGFVPGPWMQSVQVSKGAASVKNGYESLTGQINIEFVKPQGDDGVRINVYEDSKWRTEANADAGIHITDRLSTSILGHAEYRQNSHDGNGDGFLDMPKLKQVNLMHRWAYVAPSFISQLSVRVLDDSRVSGQDGHAMHDGTEQYRVEVDTRRYEAQWKNAVIFNPERNGSLALILHGSWHDADNLFGHTVYDVTQRNVYGQLMLETDACEELNVSAGMSVNHDYYSERIGGEKIYGFNGGSKETTIGAYAQLTYTPMQSVTVMPGIRWDRSDVYGSFVTPRLHVKYMPTRWLSLRASAGKGYRSPHALAENSPLLATGRLYYIDDNLRQEESFNCGLSASVNTTVADKALEVNMEYYYTDFASQMVVNFDGARGMGTVSFENLNGSSYSHTVQLDATYTLFEGMTATAAFRWNDVKTTYDGVLRRKPLTSRYKGLLTMSYKTPTELWQFDLTGQLNGNGEMYDGSEYPAYGQLQAQVTREFRHFSIYVGGENLTNYRMPNPVIGAHNPWSAGFDATQVWGPTDGAMAYVGIRMNF